MCSDLLEAAHLRRERSWGGGAPTSQLSADQHKCTEEGRDVEGGLGAMKGHRLSSRFWAF